MKNSNKGEIEKIYKKKTQLEHILDRPDAYIGSVETNEEKVWIIDEKNKKFILKEIKYTPGLYKIFDEILVNAADNYQSNLPLTLGDKKMNTIKVDIDNTKISVWNNGKGIPIVIHKEHNVYVPELIFGHFLSSSNYEDEEKRLVGGRNGFGAKLTNAYSKKFIVETCDSKKKK
jgi:DNA topoisomerase-2